MPGIEVGPSAPGERRVRLELTGAAELAALAGEAEAARVAEVGGQDGALAASIDAIGDRGFAIWAREFGSAWIDAGGRTVSCAPAREPAWRWQRFLTGQVLPFAAVLQGLEVFHASAVVVNGRAVAIVAASGSGKTALALELVLRGLPFLDDDVLVLEAGADGGLTAHPGAALANVRRDGSGLADRLCETGIGEVLGSAGHETRIVLRRHEAAVPLGAVFFLRRAGSGGRATVERLSPVDPRLLLAATFNLALRGPERLARQLEVCGRVAESAAVFRVECPPGIGAAQLAGEVMGAALALEGTPS